MRRPRRKKLLFAGVCIRLRLVTLCLPGRPCPPGNTGYEESRFRLGNDFCIDSALLLSRVPVFEAEKEKILYEEMVNLAKQKVRCSAPFEWNIFHEDCALMCTTLNYLVDGVLWLCQVVDERTSWCRIFFEVGKVKNIFGTSLKADEVFRIFLD